MPTIRRLDAFVLEGGAIMPASKYSAEQKRLALEMVRECGQSEASRKTGIPRGTISVWAFRAGVKAGYVGKVREATEAASARNAERRASIARRLLAESECFLDALHKPALVYKFGGKDNDYNEREIAEPDFQAKQQIMTSVGIALQRSLELEKHDRDDSAERTALTEWLKTVRGTA